LFEGLRRWLSRPSPFERYHFGLLANAKKHGWSGVGAPGDGYEECRARSGGDAAHTFA
jgi:hypothetical protein